MGTNRALRTVGTSLQLQLAIALSSWPRWSSFVHALGVVVGPRLLALLSGFLTTNCSNYSLFRLSNLTFSYSPSLSTFFAIYLRHHPLLTGHALLLLPLTLNLFILLKSSSLHYLFSLMPLLLQITLVFYHSFGQFIYSIMYWFSSSNIHFSSHSLRNAWHGTAPADLTTTTQGASIILNM